MKYLHIIPPSIRMMTTYVNFIEDNFAEADQHDFVSIRPIPNGEAELFDADNRFGLSGDGVKKLKNLRKLIKEYDHVIWYSFIVPHRYALFLAVHPRVRKKSTWIVWGMDLHNWQIKGGSLSARVKNWAHRAARRGFNTVVCLEEDDRTKYLRELNAHGVCVRANLPMSKESFRELEGMRIAGDRSTGKTFIQVEHNSHSFNNHLSILDSLVAVDCEDFEYYLPLAYGTADDWEGNPSDYRDLVVERSEELFESRSHVLYSMMPTDAYTRFLWNMDIAIFGSERQNGLGNILRLLYVGNKVFLPRANPTYKRLKDLGYEVFATDDIAYMSTEEFLEKPSKKAVSDVCDWIMESYYPDNLAHMWRHVFKVMNREETVEEYDARAHQGGMVVRRPEPFESTPKFKEGTLNLKPYIWKGHHRGTCGHVYIVGSGESAYRMTNTAMHLRQGMYVKGFICESDELENALDAVYYEGSLHSHFPFTETDRFILAGATPEAREYAYNALVEQEANLESFIANSAMLGKDVEVDDASLVSQGSFVNSGTRIGKGVYIGHDVVIGLNCSIGDWCIVEDGVYLGDGVCLEPRCVLRAKSAVESRCVLESGTCVPFSEIVSF